MASPGAAEPVELTAVLRFDPNKLAGVRQSISIGVVSTGETSPRSSSGATGPRLRQSLVQWVRRRSAVATAALVTGDMASFAIAWIGLSGLLDAGQTGALAGLTAVILAFYGIDGLYPGYGVYPHEILRRRFLRILGVAALSIPLACAVSGTLSSAGPIVAFVSLALLLQTPIRIVVRAALRRHGLWGVRARVTGPDRKDYEAYLCQRWQIGIRPTGPDETPELLLVAGDENPDEPMAEPTGNPDVVLLASAPGLRGAAGAPAGLRGEIGLELKRRATGPVPRALDVVVASLGLLATAPIVVLASIAIYAADPGPIFYRQVREGLGGRQFSILKLRTMYRDADSRLKTLLDGDAAARAEWASHYKLRRDPRVLPLVGAFLRSSSIDELPQLLNVLRGDMRIVGPRPLPLYHLEAMEPAFREKRCSVRPGLTGLWQVSGRSGTDLEQQQDLDDFYIDNRSFWFDVHILACTATAVMRGDGAY